MILELVDIVKTFPGVRALDKVSLRVAPGEVHGLVGENGAGKSTLMHVLGGVLQPDSGGILVDGGVSRMLNPHDALKKGVSVVFQELSLVPNLTVAENIFANRQPLNRAGLIDAGRMNAETRALLRRFNLDIAPDVRVRDLSMGLMQLVEILKAISARPQVLVLDEPTSSLSSSETELLFANVRELKKQGMSVIYISHHLPEIFEICDTVTVLRDGARVKTLPAAEVSEDQLVRLMVGRELTNMYGSRSSAQGEVFFEVKGAGRDRDFDGISFSMRRGEILGLAGLVGSGRTELARGLLGMEPLERGEVAMGGRPLRIRRVRDAMRAGIAYVTEDRKEQGLFLDMSIRDNTPAPTLRRHAGRFGLMNDRAITGLAAENLGRFKIKTDSVFKIVRQLSGGNQQKTLLSMWMGAEPGLLIADEPTRGVDVGAKSEIYGLLRELAARGTGVLMISSDMLEILGLSDRILVMRNGGIAGELAAGEATEEKIIALAAGVGLRG